MARYAKCGLRALHTSMCINMHMGRVWNLEINKETTIFITSFEFCCVCVVHAFFQALDATLKTNCHKMSFAKNCDN